MHRRMTAVAGWLAGILLFLPVPQAEAQAPATSAPGYRVPVEYFTLPNGLRVVVSEDHSSPVVLVEVMYNIGFRLEPKGRTGFAHLFEHMMFQGSAHVKKMEHVSLLQQAGGVLNGSTRFDYTNYFQVAPSNALELTLWLEADRMRSLDVSAENLKNQQNVVSEEVRVNVLNQPHASFEWLDIWEKANSNWHNAHNFYGDLKELEAATIDDVRTFFATYYAPNNAVLVVVGDTTAADVRRLAAQHFGTIPSRPQPAPPDISEPPQTAEQRATREDRLARTPALALAWHLPPRMTRDFFALSLLDPLLVGDQSARLHRALIRDESLAARVVGGFNFLGGNWDMKGPMLFTLRVDYLPTRSADEVVGAVERVIERVRTEGITAEELAEARTQLRSSFYEDLDGGFMPRFGRANLLAAFALFDDNPHRINTLMDDLDRVTVDDVRSAAARWLVPTNRTLLDSRPVTTPAPAAAKGGVQ